MLDAIGQKIYVGDIVIFGKSDRFQPINFGEVHTVGDGFIEVKGFGNQKVSKLKSFNYKARDEQQLNRVYVIDKDSYYNLQLYFNKNGGWENEL